AKDSYPIEVGWVFEDGRSEQHLIKPASNWTDWDAGAEALHGLARERLEREGTPHHVVARRMVEVLSEHDLYASAPSWDGK
ncbi:transcriptional regulator, partial [Rhizobium leguminosarum]